MHVSGLLTFHLFEIHTSQFCSALAMWQVSFREKYREVKRVNEQL